MRARATFSRRSAGPATGALSSSRGLWRNGPRNRGRLAELWNRTAGRLEQDGAFAGFEWVSWHQFEEDAKLVEVASRIEADRIVFLWVDPGEVEDLGPNEWAFASVPVWLGLGFPALFIGDRSYRSASTLAMQVMAVEENAERSPLERIPLPDVRLSHMDRGFSLWTLIVPPFLLSGAREEWHPLAKTSLEETFFRSLVYHLKTVPLPPTDVVFRCEVMTPEGESDSTRLVSVQIDSTTAVDKVDIQLDGKDYGGFAGPRLAVSEQSTEAGFRYALEVQVDLREDATSRMRIIVTSGNVTRKASLLLPQRGEAQP